MPDTRRLATNFEETWALSDDDKDILEQETLRMTLCITMIVRTAYLENMYHLANPFV